MTEKELFEKHKEKCKNCTIKNCDGVHLTINSTTKCEDGEFKQGEEYE